MVLLCSSEDAAVFCNGDLPNGFHKSSPVENGVASHTGTSDGPALSERQLNGYHASTSGRSEPLLAENDDRFTFYPIKYVFLLLTFGQLVFETLVVMF